MSVFILTKDAEVKLVEQLTALKADTLAWRMVHFRFSELLEHYRSDFQIKVALNLIADHVRENGEGGIFLCADKDIFLLCKGISRTTIDKLIFRLRYLFSDDPLAYTPDGLENDAFCSMRDLAMSWHQCFELAKIKLVKSAKKEIPPITRIGVEQEDIRPITPSRLVGLEQDLAKADLSRVLRRQPICALRPGRDIAPVFHELYINIAHLRKLTLASVDLTSNHWLFKYITQILDYKVLELLAKRPKDYFKSPVSLNLNVESLLSEQFAELDSALDPALKSGIVIEIQIADVFADMRGFIIAKDAAQRLDIACVWTG